jgi:hypothetical protein
MAIGRISGQLLKDDLARSGKNLSFDTNLLYLDVVNRRVGINNTTPSHDVQVTGTTRTTNLITSTGAQIADITLSGNTITTTSNTLNLVPNAANAVVVQAKLQVDNLELTSNNINALGGNTDINIRPNGTGQTNIYSNVEVNGNLHATGSITADGNLTLGDGNTDSITFNADITSDIRPDLNNTYNLGSASNRWLNLYTKNLDTNTLTTNSVTANGINLVLTQGKTWYIAVNGNDTKSGTHQNDPFLTLTKALSVAQPGDTIFIYPGTYSEVFPMTVPAGVTVRGAGIRSVTIQPTSGTRNKDAFLLDGETTIEDITIANFEYDAVNNTGYAFRLKTGFKVTTRSPYIRNVSVITFGSTVRLGTNPADDPRGFLSGDAGRGAYFSGHVANSLSKDVSVLFHAATFITPGVDCITVSNGVKIEWLNSFIYFANRGYYIPTNLASAGGQYGTAQVGLKIPAANRTGTWAATNTLTYYDTDGTTVLATGTIASVSGDWVYITGYQQGFATVTDRTGKTVYVQGDAKLSTAQKKFGVSSLVLDGTGDWINIASQPDFAFGTNDFCLEAQIYNGTTGVYQPIFEMRSVAVDTAIFVGLFVNNTIYVYINGAIVIQSPSVVPSNTWTHIALARSGTSLKLFINGTQAGSTYTDTNNYPERALRIGNTYDGVSGYTGYIDEVRISTNIPRYTSNFAAPTQAFTSDLDTVLLLHFNGANNATVITDDGVTRQDLRTSAGGTANQITYADYTKFGAEIRSIGSANVYGNYGYVGDGAGCIAYLISQNFAYIGSGRFSTNDPTQQITANQIVKTNSAKIYYTSVDNQGDFKVGDFFEVNQKTGAVTFNGSSFNIPTSTSIVLTDGVNTTTIDATKVETGNLRISGNTISSLTGDIILSPSNGNITISSNKSFVIPKGTTAQRPSPADQASFRYNTTENWFEGYTGTAWVPLGLITDSNRTTYVQADTTPGDKTISFFANSNLVATLNDTAFTTNRVDVGNFSITSNTISAVTPNTDIEIQPTGTGGLIVSNLKITTNSITNLTSGAITTLSPTGTGYVKIPGTNGVVIPSGTSSLRPAYAEVGMIRWNTELGQTEVFSGPGTGWVSVTGTTGAVNVATANDIALLQALIFG